MFNIVKKFIYIDEMKLPILVDALKKAKDITEVEQILFDEKFSYSVKLMKSIENHVEMLEKAKELGLKVDKDIDDVALEQAIEMEINILEERRLLELKEKQEQELRELRELKELKELEKLENDLDNTEENKENGA